MTIDQHEGMDLLCDYNHEIQQALPVIAAEHAADIEEIKQLTAKFVRSVTHGIARHTKGRANPGLAHSYAVDLLLREVERTVGARQ